MPAADNSRIPVGKFGWLVVVAVLASPLLFFALVTPKEKPVSESTKIELPPSKLQAVGLKENRDWDGLPEMFAVWQDHVQWRDNKTRFAFWNPGSRSYSYYFEATREEERIVFKALSRKDVFAGRYFYADGTYFGLSAIRRHDDPEPVDEFRESATHPFLFFRDGDVPIAVIPPVRW